VVLIVAVASPRFFSQAIGPLSVMLISLLLVSSLLWRSRKSEANFPPQLNPSQMKIALIFAAAYAVVLLGTAAARDYFGTTGLYVAVLIAGSTDMDAITLSVSQMAGSGSVTGSTGWRLIMAGALSNLVFKAVIIATLGSRKLLLRMGVLFSLAFGLGIALIVLWP
jgi:uncharacterized membrane protein (DUF4010 family)